MQRTLLRMAIGAFVAGLATSVLAQGAELGHGDNVGESEGQTTGTGFEEMGPTQIELDSSVALLQVDEVEGMTVSNVEGETVGQVENVLRHNDVGDLHAVVSVGGFWVFGGSEVALPLTDMRLEGNKLVLQDIIGEDELNDLATGYDEARYSDIDGDLTLGDAMDSLAE